MAGDELSAIYLAFADQECGDAPLYARLARGIAADPDLLALAACARSEVRPFYLILVATHFLVLREPSHELARWYPDVAPGAPPAADPFPVFRQFCLERRREIADLLETRGIHANSPVRCSYLLPALAVASALGGRPLAFLDVGSGAGLHLLFDQYCYRYSDGQRTGDPASPVVIECEVMGSCPPPVPAVMPPVATRWGIDLAPIRPDDEGDSCWLRALVFPERPGRLRPLEAALRLAAADPPRVFNGDVLEMLVPLASEQPPEALVCVHDSCFLHHLSPEDQHRYAHQLIPAVASTRELVWISARGGQLHLSAWMNGVCRARVLARHDPQGEWIEWTAGD